MPAALPGMCVSRWTLLDVASGGSAGRSADAGAANARANAAASHLMALPPTTGPYTQPLSISTLPVRLIGDHPRKGGTHMRYLLLIHQGTTPTPRDPEAWAQLSEDERNAVFSDYKAINETPGVTPGEQMDSPETATTVRVQDGRTLTTDGPFAELKEAIGGYLFFEADNLDAAIELAARVPAARLGGAVEVRPITQW